MPKKKPKRRTSTKTEMIAVRFHEVTRRLIESVLTPTETLTEFVRTAAVAEAERRARTKGAQE